MNKTSIIRELTIGRLKRDQADDTPRPELWMGVCSKCDAWRSSAGSEPCGKPEECTWDDDLHGQPVPVLPRIELATGDDESVA